MVKLMSTSERKLYEALVIPLAFHPNFQLVRGKRNSLNKRNLSLASPAAPMVTRINVREWDARGTRIVLVSAVDN